jgi:hypothetical protein
VARQSRRLVTRRLSTGPPRIHRIRFTPPEGLDKVA